MKNFGNIIKEARLKKDLSLRDLSNIADLDFSYISRIEKGYKPSRDAVIKLSNALNIPHKELLGIAGYAPKIELLNILEDDFAEITVANKSLSAEQREAIMKAIQNPVDKHYAIPILGTIRAGIPLLSGQNIIGHLDIPADLVNRADFALIVNGDSMIGAGINDRDIVICKQKEEAFHGQIVVALVNNDETTLKFFVKENGRSYLRAANPEYPDLELKPEDKIQGYVLRVQKEAPSPNSYREYIYFRDGHLQEWNAVVETATSYGIKPDKVKSILDMHWEMVNKK